MPAFLRSLNHRFWHSRLGIAAVTAFVRFSSNHVFGPWTAEAMRLDVARLRARAQSPKGQVSPLHPKLHLGCGPRHVEGWVNADVIGGDCLVDLSSGKLPWKDKSFDSVVCQQVIEHLELYNELIPLLREMRRVTRHHGEIWLACPDMEKVCRSYVENSGSSLLDEYQRWYPQVNQWRETPAQIINLLFTQEGEHKNLFDISLLQATCAQAGLSNVARVSEGEMLKRFPEFPARGDDQHSLYVKIVVAHSPLN